MIQYGWNKRFFEKNKGILVALGIIAFFFIIINYDDDKFNVDIQKDFNVFLVILAAAVMLLYLIGKVIKERIMFFENELVVEKCFAGKKMWSKKYAYREIYKFIIGKFYEIKSGNIQYIIYIDRNNEIIKVTTTRDYRNCLKIIDEIKRKSGKLLYDATDDHELIEEEDLFRNYYKMKMRINEVKNGD